MTAAQREMQARLAYAELITPPSQRREPAHPHINRMPAHGFAYQGQSSDGRTWSSNQPLSSGTDTSFDFGLRDSPRSQTSPQGGFQESFSPARSHSGDDANADIKRRKNTEASGELYGQVLRTFGELFCIARFRVKKKEKMEQLEHNMSHLQQRAESLEKEAGDLRRENGWLKEMVVMKRGKGSSASQGRREQHKPEDEGQYQGSDGSSDGDD